MYSDGYWLTGTACRRCTRLPYCCSPASSCAHAYAARNPPRRREHVGTSTVCRWCDDRLVLVIIQPDRRTASERSGQWRRKPKDTNKRPRPSSAMDVNGRGGVDDHNAGQTRGRNRGSSSEWRFGPGSSSIDVLPPAVRQALDLAPATGGDVVDSAPFVHLNDNVATGTGRRLGVHLVAADRGATAPTGGVPGVDIPLDVLKVGPLDAVIGQRIRYGFLALVVLRLRGQSKTGYRQDGGQEQGRFHCTSPSSLSCRSLL